MPSFLTTASVACCSRCAPGCCGRARMAMRRVSGSHSFSNSMRLPTSSMHEFAVNRITAESEDDGFCSLYGLHCDGHEFLRHYDLGIGREHLARRRLHVFPTGCPEHANAQIATFNPA